jgi:microtubule-associated protein-like 6
MHNDGYLISTGGRDNCILVWKTDCVEESRELRAATAVSASLTSNASDTIATEGEAWGEATASDWNISYGVFPASADEFMAVRPYRDAIVEPTAWTEPPHCGLEPDELLELVHVHGYRAQDCRNNLLVADSPTELVYHVAAVGIVYDSTTHKQVRGAVQRLASPDLHCKQVRNTAQTDDIISIAVHPQGHTVATGSLGRKPVIILFDANNGITLHKIQGFHKRGVCCLAFSASGAFLASVGLDENHSMAIYDVRTAALTCTSKGNRARTLCLAFCGENCLLTGGDKYVKFWEFSSAKHGELTSKQGLFGKKANIPSALSAVYIGTDAVTGMSDGTLMVWKGRNVSKAVAAHLGSVNALYMAIAGKPQCVSGGKDGKVVVWSAQLTPLWKFALSALQPGPYICQIQAVCLVQERLLIGTKSSEIWELDIISLSAIKHVDGHYDGEVWGLAVHPRDNIYVTCGDDFTVRLWDALTCRMDALVDVRQKARACAYSPDGLSIVVGLYSGGVKV